MSWKWIGRGFLLSLIVFMTACSSNVEYSKDEASSSNVMSDSMEMDYAASSSRDGFAIESETKVDEGQSFNDTERMMIYQANLSVEVKDYHEVEADIQKKVNTLGGYVVQSSIYSNNEEWINGNLVVRIPQQYFYSFINEVESASIRVHDRNVQGNDVTEEYVDLESRLKSKRVVEERLLSFLKEAEKTEDLLKISSDLAKVQEEIEQLLGRMNYLKNHVNFSTVTIHMSEKLVNIQTLQDKEALNTWIKAKSLFMDSINGLISFSSSVLIFLIGRSPMIFIGGLIALAVTYFLRKRNTNKPYQG